jgi:hypothetical protein
MLDAYIIEQIRKREDERRRIHERPALELPLEPYPPHEAEEDEVAESPRVIVIEL